MFNTIEIEIDGHKVTFKRAGMTEYYDFIEKHLDQSQEENQRKLLAEMKSLEEKENRTEDEEARFNKASAEFSRLSIPLEKLARKFVMDHAVSITKDGQKGDEKDAQLFVDTQNPAKISELMNDIKPDLEKN